MKIAISILIISSILNSCGQATQEKKSEANAFQTQSGKKIIGTVLKNKDNKKSICMLSLDPSKNKDFQIINEKPISAKDLRQALKKQSYGKSALRGGKIAVVSSLKIGAALGGTVYGYFGTVAGLGMGSSAGGIPGGAFGAFIGAAIGSGIGTIFGGFVGTGVGTVFAIPSAAVSMAMERKKRGIRKKRALSAASFNLSEARYDRFIDGILKAESRSKLNGSCTQLIYETAKASQK